MHYVYCVIKFYVTDLDADVSPDGCLEGIYLSKDKAVEDLTASGPHDVWEYAYGVVAIEKYRFNSLGHPCVVKDKEPALWFLWHWNDEKRTGGYQPCSRPKWAEGVIGFI